MSDNKKITVELYDGTSKKGNNFTAIKVCIGDWSGLLFPRTSFELNYIKQVLESK